jgi:Ca2+-transporting ATPase
MDGPPAQSLGVEPINKNSLDYRKRHKKNESLIDLHLFFDILLAAFVIVTGTVFVFLAEV